MQESIYVGLDMGSSRCQQAVINADGKLRLSRVVLTSEQHLRRAFTGLDGDAHVHLESGELSAWAAGIIGPLVEKVVVSHPRTLVWIARDPLKTDKRDAAKLAELRGLGGFTKFTARRTISVRLSSIWLCITRRCRARRRGRSRRSRRGLDLPPR